MCGGTFINYVTGKLGDDLIIRKRQIDWFRQGDDVHKLDNDDIFRLFLRLKTICKLSTYHDNIM